MSETAYNGWTNYETWNVALWLDNEQASYDYWREQAREHWEAAEALKPNYWTREETARFHLADTLKADFEAGKDELLEEAKKTASVWADLLGAALSEVNWEEIARHYIEEIAEEATT